MAATKIKVFAFAFVLAFVLPSCAQSGAGPADAGGEIKSEAGAPDQTNQLEPDGDGEISAQPSGAMDLAGTVVKILDYENFLFADKWNWGYTIYMFIKEWEEMTGAKVEMLPGLMPEAVAAGVAADEGYDLSPPGDLLYHLRLLSDIDDRADYFMAKYGVRTMDNPGLTKFAGSYYAILYPWELDTIQNAVIYNADLLTRLGIERPSQQFLRGEWTWKAYSELVDRIGTLDLDGDGKPDYVTALHYYATLPMFVPVYDILEDESYVNLSNSQRLRDYAELVYTAVNVNGTMEYDSPYFAPDGYGYNGERYPAVYPYGCASWYVGHFFNVLDAATGDWFEFVPMPDYGDGYNYRHLSLSGLAFMNGSGNREGAVSLVDFVYESVAYLVLQYPNEGLRNYKFNEHKPALPEVADYLDYLYGWYDGIRERARANPYYDEQYYKSFMEWHDGLPLRFGVSYRTGGFGIPDNTIFTEMPPATAVAEFNKIMQLQVDEYNETYIFTR